MARRVTAQASAVWDSRTGTLRLLDPHEIPIRAGDVIAMDGDVDFPAAVLEGLPHRLAPVFAERILRLPVAQDCDEPPPPPPRGKRGR